MDHLPTPRDIRDQRTDADPVAWRQLSRSLWVGRRADQPVGIIEQGRHFTLIDANERAHPGFTTLKAAQIATESIEIIPPAAAAAGASVAGGDDAAAARRSRPLASRIAAVVSATALAAVLVAVLQVGSFLLLAH